MKASVVTVLALLCLVCCSQTVSAQGPAFYEFLGYISGLERNKGVDWNSTLYLLYTGQVTPTCFTDAYRVYNDTILVKSYASNMLDSTGKMTPSGMFQGNWVAMGDYEECTVNANNAPDKPENFQTMYCSVAWGGIPESLAPENQFYAQGVCVPNTCTDKDVGLLTGTATHIFLSFSVFTNARKLFSLKTTPGQLPALHGIRVISTLWIIFGHTNFFTIGNIEISNKVELAGASKEWWYFIQNNMDMAVDTFLLLSGLLVTYLFMKQLSQTGGVFTWRDYGLHLLHRYCRLTPVYAFLIMIYTCLLVYMGDGPYWATPSNWVMPGIHGCQHHWWTNLLYINNYFVDSGVELFLFISFAFLAFVCGFAASMMAEVPFLELEKILLPNRRGREAKPEPDRGDVEGQQYQSLVQDGTSLNINFLNIRSYLEHLQDLTADRTTLPVDVFCFVETFLYPNQQIEPFLPQSQAFRADRIGRGGGVMTVAKQDISPTQLRIEVGGLECTATTVTKASTTVNIVNIYRPPSLPEESFIDRLQRLLEQLPSDILTIILGDFNFDLLKHPPPKILAAMGHFGFSQHVKFPTTDSGALLDHVYVRGLKEDNVLVSVMDTYYSDHDMVCVSLML
uniref:Nose resistant-to-fluoxetine protein N-terminal domain-containing protein n=1 Tax=Branchiostoma floridae TaxID=7739 RepID=C3ZP78_BRAFL|eukprot:XP_002589564.1 hypothetical protein BRAFLDRAFT_81521 [Branchiostoma floridae]